MWTFTIIRRLPIQASGQKSLCHNAPGFQNRLARHAPPVARHEERRLMTLQFMAEKQKKKLTQIRPSHIIAARVGLPEFDCVTTRNWNASVALLRRLVLTRRALINPVTQPKLCGSAARAFYFARSQ
jgi:hypothetical protein